MKYQKGKIMRPVSGIEKIISVLSYFTMGFAGILWIFLAYILKRRLRYFLMYNIIQSMIISLSLAIIGLTLNIIFSIIAKIPFLDFIVAVINLVVSLKVLTIYRPFEMSFSLFQIFIYIIILYITAGIIAGRILYVPFLTDLMNKVMKKYGQ